MSRILPEKIKKTLKREYNLRFFTILSFIFSLIIVLTLIFISPSYLLLHLYEKAYEVNGSATRVAEVTQMQEGRNNKINDLNSLSAKIPTNNEEIYAKVSNLLINETQDYVSVDALELTPIASGKLKIVLRGGSTTRENLMTFESVINKNNSFKNFSIPIEVLAKQKDISFNLTFEYHEN